VQRHTHPEPSFFENVGTSLTRSVRKCLTSTGECLEPKIKEERERKEKLRSDELSKLDSRYVTDDYNRQHSPSGRDTEARRERKWFDDLDDDNLEYNTSLIEQQRQNAIEQAMKAAEFKKAAIVAKDTDIAAKRNLEFAIQAAELVDRDDETRSNAGWQELHRVRRNLEDATNTAKAAAAKVAAAEVAEAELARINKQRATELARINKQRKQRDYQGGRKTKKIKHRHHKKSLRHRKKSLRHNKKSLRHNKKSMRHHNKY
jgi:hypothetical protein